MVFVEPGAAPPVQAKVSGRKLLYSTLEFFVGILVFRNSHDISRRQI